MFPTLFGRTPELEACAQLKKSTRKFFVHMQTSYAFTLYKTLWQQTCTWGISMLRAHQVKSNKCQNSNTNISIC